MGRKIVKNCFIFKQNGITLSKTEPVFSKNQGVLSAELQCVKVPAFAMVDEHSAP